MAKKQQTQHSNQTAETMNDKAFNSRLQECPIAIVGMASIFADAKNLEDYWDNIFEAVNGIKDVPNEQWAIDDYFDSDPSAPDQTYCKRGGFLPEIDFDPMEFGLPPNLLELTDIAQLLSLVVAREVLNDAGIGDGSGYDRDKVGITLGIGGGQKQIGPLHARLQGPVLEKVLTSAGVESNDRAMIIEKFKKAYIKWEENSFPGMLGNVIAGRIANRFDFGGTNCVVDAACASSLSAIKLAISDLLEYRSEVMISGGVCCDNSPFMYMSFSKTPAFTSNEDIRPFDVDSKGMMIGEGIGMMAFKRLEDAERDGDRIYAVLKGIGTSSDGRFKSIYAPRPDGQAKALSRAYKDAGFDPKTCGLIEAHGTGTKAGDAAEFSGLRKHFSQDNEATQHIALGSVKSQIGHTKAAAGAAGMIKAVLALHHKVLPPSINIDTPNPALDIENSPLYLNSETRPWLPREDGKPRRAGISSFGFGGTNFHMVLEEYQAEAQGQYRLTNVPQTILMHAGDSDITNVANDNDAALIATLTHWQSQLTTSADNAPYIFNALVTEFTMKTLPANVARCGFVAKNADEALTMITSALNQFNLNKSSEHWATPSGIFYRKSALSTSGKVVALFSGQGSQYVNMGQDLACNFPSVLQTTAAMDKEFAQSGLGHLSATSFPIPAFNDKTRAIQEDTLRLTQFAQPAIGTFSVGLFKTFTEAGFKADFTAGHSFGELTALWAAGVFSEQDYMMLARSRGQAMAAPAIGANDDFDAGTMIAVVGDPKEVAKDIKDISDVSIANYNANNQVVVAGTTAQIAVAIDVLKGQSKAKGYKVVPLPVSAAFHTPLVQHAQKPFADAIDKVTFKSPRIPVFANGTGKAHASKGNEIKKALKNHILESVHFNKEVDNLYAQGGRVFIEFGPKSVLTKLVDNILQDKSDVTTIAINANAKQSSDKQLRQAAVQMAVLGIPLEEIDKHSAVKRPLSAPKMSPLAMKLSGKSYVSPKTEKAFADALADGQVISQVQQLQALQSKPIENTVEKIVEVERIVEVEKLVYVGADGKPLTDQTQAALNHSANLAAKSTTPQNFAANAANPIDIEQSISQFVSHQQQVLNVHEQYMQGSKDYSKTVETVLNSRDSQLGHDGQSSKEIPESVERTLSMYHDFQSETLRVHEQYLNNQNEHMAELLQTDHLPNTAHNTHFVTSDNTPIQSAPQVVEDTRPQSEVVVTPIASQINNDVITPAPVINQPSTTSTVNAKPTVVPEIDLSQIEKVMMEVVADKTGYPAEMLELDMDMEADLGIDSIKRVEILGSVQEVISNLPDLNPEDLAELRTLGEIVSYMQEKSQAVVQSNAETSAHSVEGATQLISGSQANLTQIVPSPTSSSNIDLAEIEKVMLEVVADKTGYPVEMLALDMDMEADLGIDSIKRVEILGSVQEVISNLPDLNPEDLAELRTLGEIVSYMQARVVSKEGNPETAVTTTEVPSTIQSDHATQGTNATIDLEHIENVMLEVVADKTGYPPEMLELAMDMEADLGIDSIKRVEILGSVQEIISDLPDLNPEDLAELRTLGEIVNYMQSKVAPGNTPESQTAMLSVTPAVTATFTQEPTDAQVAVQAAVQATKPSDNAINLVEIENTMMSVVAEKTGYPPEMLELAMDMEADLGIDSIKRVEILGGVQEIISHLPELNPEDLAELRTLGEIVSYMQEKAQADASQRSGKVAESEVALSEIVQSEIAQPKTLAVNPPVIDLAHIEETMMAVVADKTGYPPEMLELAMDMEADLGIDSIKRVEILGGVQEIITDLPELNPEDLAELRTLGEIVSYMQVKSQGNIEQSNAKHAVSDQLLEVSSEEISTKNVISPAIDLVHIEKTMLTVVADKTGYPPEMLELAMDMEADLGIDSIKRVEILGGVQEIINDLPELNPEDLAELRTLGEIVSYMQACVTKPTESTDLHDENQAETVTRNYCSAIDTAIEKELFDAAPSATVDLQVLSSVNKIVQAFDSSTATKPQMLLVDDGSGTAVMLSKKLTNAGWTVTVLKPNWLVNSSKKAFDKTVNLVEIGNQDNLVDEAQLSQLLHKSGQFDAVIYLQEKQNINGIEYPENAKQGLMLAFLLAKLSHVKNAKVARATFMVVTRQGGTLGYSNTDASVDAKQESATKNAINLSAKTDLVQGGLAGLVKTLAHEWQATEQHQGVFCRIVDLSPKLAASKAADIISDELLDIDTSLIEVAHDSDNLSHDLGQRLTLVSIETNSYALASNNSIDKNAVFIVSGGAKGVTAHCVVEIAKKYQANFILLGRSPLLTQKLALNADETEPSWANGHHDEVALKKAAMQVLIASGEKPTPVKVSQFVKPILANREILQTLNAITVAGGHVQYVAADVTDKQSVMDAVQKGLTALSTSQNKALQVTGIIHGAGVLADKFIEQKTLSEFNAVYDTKIAGLQSLLAACKPEQLKHLVLFSSAAGFYGNPGQSDYAIANDILNKTAYRFKALNPQAQVLSFNWGPWDGGMVTPELKRMFDQRGVYIIPLDAGAKLLVSELGANSNRCAQILVGNDLSKTAETTNEHNSVKKPLVSHLSTRVTKTLQVANNPFFADHTIGEDQVFPTVCAIAWMADASEKAYPGFKYLGINQYKLLKGVTFDAEAALKEGSDKSFYIEMNIKEQASEEQLLVESKISSINEAGKTVYHYAGQLMLSNKSSQHNTPLNNVSNQVKKQFEHYEAIHFEKSSEKSGACLYQNGTLFHGESLQGIEDVIYCDDQQLLLACKVPAVATTKQGEFSLQSSGHNIFANDLVYQAMLVWVKKELGLGSLPSSTDAWTTYAEVEFDKAFYLHLTVVESTGKNSKRGKLVADIQIINKDMQIIAEVKSAKVTASASLNNLFLANSTKANQSVKTTSAASKVSSTASSSKASADSEQAAMLAGTAK